MRALPANLAATLDTGAATLCRCWRLTRADATQLGFTDHDRDLVIGGLTFEANDGFEASAIESAAGLATGGGEIRGLLTSDRIKAQEIEAGLYDSARLEVFLVDWRAPALDFRLEAASLGEIRRIDGHFVAETRDVFAACDMERGRLYAAACAARFGDAACGIDALAPEHTIHAAVATAPAPRVLDVTAAASHAPGFFTQGLVRITGGEAAGFTSGIEAHAGSRITLAVAPPAVPAPGDTLTLTAGCDKRLTTCHARFGNALNFRGFPYIPAPESVFAYARPGEGTHKGRPLVR